MSTRAAARPARAPPARRAARCAARRTSAGAGSSRCSSSRSSRPWPRSPCCPTRDKAVQEIALPLRHEDIIRQQAPTRASIPRSSRASSTPSRASSTRTSHAGARGLMQITPGDGATTSPSSSGGTKFEQGDLATPQINIAYGAWYLRYLLDRYDGNEVARAGRLQRRRGQRRRGCRRRTARTTAFTSQRDPVRRDARVRQAGARRPRRLPHAVRARARALASAGPITGSGGLPPS